MRKFGFNRHLFPASVKRLSDNSAAPLFAYKRRKFSLFSLIFEKNEYVCRKWSIKNTINLLLIILPLTIITILTSGICASINEKIDIFTKKDNQIKNNYSQNDGTDKNILFVVNEKSPILPEYKPDLTHYMQIECDKKITKNLDEMLKTAKKLGYNLNVTKGFIKESIIKKNYEEKISQFLKEGFTQARAENLAKKTVSSPGKSEYQTGLLVDICIPNISSYDFIKSDAYNWLKSNCVNFGFIQRYPENKVYKTLKDFNPFAFRFVGKFYAHKITSLSMCLEEYCKYINSK